MHKLISTSKARFSRLANLTKEGTGSSVYSASFDYQESILPNKGLFESVRKRNLKLPKPERRVPYNIMYSNRELIDKFKNATY